MNSRKFYLLSYRIVQVGLRSVSVESHSDWKITRVMAYEGFRSEYNHTHHDIGEKLVGLLGRTVEK